MIRHEKIKSVIDNPETRSFLKGLFEKNMSEGTDRTSILRFCETLTDILRDEVGIVKGKRQTSTVSDGWREEIKNRKRYYFKLIILAVLNAVSVYLPNHNLSSVISMVT